MEYITAYETRDGNIFKSQIAAQMQEADLIAKEISKLAYNESMIGLPSEEDADKIVELSCELLSLIKQIKGE